ncbi:MAG: hypothetical protein QGH11_12335, partial [Pirellulaceae bacterium]|nr:hypothetical protein [Pirellulaceae bacterium]
AGRSLTCPALSHGARAAVATPPAATTRATRMKKIRLTIKAVKDEKRKGLSGFSQWQVKFEGFDPFQTKAPLVTYLEVSRWYRPRQKQTAILILRSARPPKDDDPVWKQLRQFRAVIK